MDRYFAVVDDHHDAKDPITVIRVVKHAGSARVTQLGNGASWVRTTLLDRIEAGEAPYRLQPINGRAATRIRERREKEISFRYSIIVRDDDPTDQPIGVLREWDAPDGSWSYSETYTRNGEWEHSNVRLDIERSSSIRDRLVPSDAATVHQYIDSFHRR